MYIFSILKFEKTGTDDSTYGYEEVQNSSGAQNGMNKINKCIKYLYFCNYNELILSKNAQTHIRSKSVNIVPLKHM